MSCKIGRRSVAKPPLMDEPRTPPFQAMGTFASMPSIAEPPTLPLFRDEMAAINQIMNRTLRRYMLPADDDTAEWKLTLETVVKALVGELSTTVSKANFIPFQEVQELIEKLDDD